MSEPQFSPHQNLSVPEENRITYFAVTDTRNKRVPFGIQKEDRSRHTYVIGKTGMGKSTLLENMAVQDIQNGEGLCFIDPHGGTAEKLLEYIPEERIKDVLYFAPFDLQYPISFNVLEDVDADKRHLVVAGLMSAFEKIWVDAWSARMAYILQNTIGALLEFPGATLLSVNRMYIDKEYRKNVVAKVTDPSVRSFWVDEFTKYTDRYAQEATPAIQNKIGQFASNALVRNIIGQEQSAFDMRKLMDEHKIFIVNLSKGRMGEGNANLLGSMLITKLYLAAMSRADTAQSELRKLPNFYLYVDEFQNFANRSFADILAEARKYKLCLTIAHQYIEQMEEEVRAAVFGNVGTMMTFRVGAYDAEVLEKEFAPVFTADDLVNLGQYQLYLKLMINAVSSQPFSAVTMPPIGQPEVNHSDRAVAFSRAQFSRPRAEVEKDISDWSAKKYEDPEAEAKEKARQERRALRAREEDRPPRNNMQPREYRQPAQDRRPVGRTQTPGVTRTLHDGPSNRHEHRPQAQYKNHSAHTTPDKKRPTASRRENTRPSRPMSPRTSAAQDSAPKESLQNVLSRVASTKAPAQPDTQAPDEKSSTVSQLPKRPLAPARDDGKGVTDKGKQELRNLLSTLSNNDRQSQTDTKPTKPATTPKEVPQPAPAPKREQPQPHEKKESKAPAQADTTDKQTAKQPKEIPQEELKNMLHVEKPNLD